VADTQVLLDGLHFGEGPRWHDGRLWYSDMYDLGVHAVDLEGNDERVLEVPQQPSGLGWMPDGSLLVVSMLDRSLMRWDGTTLSLHADLSAYASWHCNDMVVDAAGRAYVGNFGFDYEDMLQGGDAGPTGAIVCRVDPDGSVTAAAFDLLFPNGTVITPDGRTLIVAETFGARLSAYDVAEDGSLSNRRVWADLASEGVAPDGISLDAEGCIWVAPAIARRCVRVAEGGEVVGEIETAKSCFACMLGGPDGRTLFAMTAPGSEHEEAAATRAGCIEIAQVDVPHAGLP
jgi:sugar lactone lactonase YvrE